MDIHAVIHAWKIFSDATKIGAIQNDAHCDHLIDLHERLLDYSFTLDGDAFAEIQALITILEAMLADYDDVTAALLAQEAQRKRPQLRLVKNSLKPSNGEE